MHLPLLPAPPFVAGFNLFVCWPLSVFRPAPTVCRVVLELKQMRRSVAASCNPSSSRRGLVAVLPV
jgi:hypothetical protein